jgi:hypothetical protein
MAGPGRGHPALPEPIWLSACLRLSARHPIIGHPQQQAKLIGRRCPIRTECLAEALDGGREFGV